MDLQLRGKRAVVLGGTRGIGRAICETFVAEGADVALCARNKAQIDEAVSALLAGGTRVVGGQADMGDGPAVKAWIDQVALALGGIDILVSNASALTMGAHAGAWESLLRVDILGAAAAFEAARPYLEKSVAASGDASFTMISSVSAAEAQNASAYGAIKAAMIHYGKGLARECARSRIRVNVVSPGTIYFKGGVWHNVEQNAPQMFEATLKRNPLGRMGTPQDIANTTVFLASPASSFTTGANVLVDGAISARVNF